MIRLIYVSSATKEMSQQELVELLSQSREKNQLLNITGMLLYSGGNFFQILEGEKNSVEELYAKITKDERHTDCIMIDESEIKDRTFPNWSMGFKNLNLESKESLAGYSEFLNKKLNPKDFLNKVDEVFGLLENFKNTSY